MRTRRTRQRRSRGRSVSPGLGQRREPTVVAAPRQRLGDRERVLDAAARLDRVGEHRDLHAATSAGAIAAQRAGGWPRRWRARRSRRRRAGSASGGRRPAGRRRSRRRARARRRASPAAPIASDRPEAGSGCRRGRARRRAARSRRLVRGGLLEEAEPDVEVDHRVRPALRVLLLAEVEHGVAAVALVGAVADVALQRAELGLEQRDRLVRQRAAGEQAEQAAAAERSRARRRPSSSERSAGVGAGRGARGGLERVVDLERRSSPPSQPTNAATTRLPPGRSIAPSAATTSGAGGLETSSSVSVSSSAASIRIAWRNMIPPMSADRSRPPTPTICETPTPAPSSRLADSCAPVPAAATMPTGPEAHDVGEAEPDLAEHRGAAARAHDEQPELRAAALELELVRLARRGRRRGRRACRRSARGAPRAWRTRRGPRSARRWRRRARRRNERARRLAIGVARRRGGRGQLALGAVERGLRRLRPRSRRRSARRSHVDAERGERLEVGGRAHRHLGRDAVRRAGPWRSPSAARCRRSGCATTRTCQLTQRRRRTSAIDPGAVRRRRSRRRAGRRW